jgi:glucokinase
MNIVAVDIGGTNARFAIATLEDGQITLSEPVILSSKDHANFETAWDHFAEIHARQSDVPLPKDAALALAAPVDGETIRFANIHWVIQPAALGERLGIERVTLINDFGAMGHAAATVGPEFFTHIAGPDQPFAPQGTLSIVGPGTGLGIAHVWRDGKGFYNVQSTEGGHIDFAPVDAIDDAILARLRKRHRRVSVERVVSGEAIVDVYETLAALEERAIVPVDAKSIWQLADAGEDALAVAAAERFCLSLGSAAGDYALAHGSCGVVLAGGVGQRQAARIIASGFHSRFTAKGRFENLMSGIPVKLITHPQPGLLGAAAAFQKEHGQ